MLIDHLSFQEKQDLLKELATKISIAGAMHRNDQFLQLLLKQGANMNNVKSILKKYFGIDYYRKFCPQTLQEQRFAKDEDIEKLCKVYLEANLDLDYYNHFDPLRKRDKISKAVYRYGKVRYDLLRV